jgi:hypothetical protein
MCDVLYLSLILRTGWPIVYTAFLKAIASFQDLWTMSCYALR